MKLIVCRFGVGSGACFRILTSYQSTMLAMLLWVPTAFAETLTIPAGAETRENQYNIAEPFSRPGNIVSQQIYSSSLFPTISAPGQLFQLDGMAFRLSSQGIFGGSVSATFDRVEILVSTAGGPFSTALAQNHGPNLSVVFDESLSLAGTIPAGDSPSGFDLSIPFTNPFLYNPADGSLVIEIRKFGADRLPVLGGAEIPGNLFYFNRGFGVETSGSIGLETRFSYTTIPEPNILTIFGCGLAILCVVKRKTV